MCTLCTLLISRVAYLQLPIHSPQRSTVMPVHQSNGALFLVQLVLPSHLGAFDMSVKQCCTIIRLKLFEIDKPNVSTNDLTNP